MTCLALVEVVEDFTTQVLLALPLTLTRVMEEIPQGPVLPLQQLPVQQQSESCLCCVEGVQVKDQHNKSVIGDNLLSTVTDVVVWPL